MDSILYVFSNVVYLVVVSLSFMLMLRAIMSWFMPDEGNSIYNFLITVTEPIVLPVRSILDSIEFFRQMPIDMSIFVTMLILSIVQVFL